MAKRRLIGPALWGEYHGPRFRCRHKRGSLDAHGAEARGHRHRSRQGVSIALCLGCSTSSPLVLYHVGHLLRPELGIPGQQLRAVPQANFVRSWGWFWLCWSNDGSEPVIASQPDLHPFSPSIRTPQQPPSHDCPQQAWSPAGHGEMRERSHDRQNAFLPVKSVEIHKSEFSGFRALNFWDGANSGSSRRISTIQNALNRTHIELSFSIYYLE